MSLLTADSSTLSGSEMKHEEPGIRPVRQQCQVLKDYVDTIAFLDDPSTLHTDPIVKEFTREYRCSYKSELSQITKDFIDEAEAEFVLEEVKGLARAICNRFESSAKTEDIISSTSIKMDDCQPSCCSYSLKGAERSNNGTLADEHTSFRDYLRRDCIDWIHIGAIRECKDYLAPTFLCSFTIFLQLAVRYTGQTDWLDAFASVDTAPSTSPLSLIWTLARRDPQIGRMTADVVVLIAMGSTIRKRMDYTAKFGKSEEKKLAKAERKALSTPLRVQLKDDCKRTISKVLRSPTTRKRQRDEAKAKKREGEWARRAVQETARELKEQGERYAQCIENRKSQEERRFVFQSIQKLVLRIFADSQPTVDSHYGREPPVPKPLSRAVEELGEGYKRRLITRDRDNMVTRCKVCLTEV